VGSNPAVPTSVISRDPRQTEPSFRGFGLSWTRSRTRVRAFGLCRCGGAGRAAEGDEPESATRSVRTRSWVSLVRLPEVALGRAV